MVFRLQKIAQEATELDWPEKCLKVFHCVAWSA